MEAVISRMKTVKNLADNEESVKLSGIPHVMSGAVLPSRFIAVSATIPNVEDVSFILFVLRHRVLFKRNKIPRVVNQFDISQDRHSCIHHFFCHQVMQIS